MLDHCGVTKRLNTAIFNCADENEVTSQLAGRFWARCGLKMQWPVYR